MKLALVHDALLRFGGAERVLKEFHALFPDAPIFTFFADPKVRSMHFPEADVRTSFLDHLPFARRHYRWTVAAMPVAVESFDLRDYDVVLSSASGLVKGIITRVHTVHLCYCHTPPRFLWEDRKPYRRAHVPLLLSGLAIPLQQALRLWDQHAAQRVDAFLANSSYTAERIRRYYGRQATVVYPPVDTTLHPLREETARRFALPDEYFLSVGQLVWWKRPELTVETFNRLGLPLVVAGTGPMEGRLRRMAKSNVRFLGWQPDSVVRQLMSGARALVHPQTEDFGIAAVEAMAEGTPVVAYRQGGATETVREGISGTFFDDPDPVAFADAVRRLREGQYRREAIRAAAAAYDVGRFHAAVRDALDAVCTRQQ